MSNGRSLRLHGIYVLVVDDHADCREVFRTALGIQSARVATATNIEQALAAVAAEVPTVIITEMLATHGGIDIVTVLRAALSRCPPIVVVSAWSARDLPPQVRAHAAAYLLKPVSLDDLVRTIERVCRPRANGKLH